MCLLNMYTSRTHHIYKERDDPCTCYVCVVYMLDKHIHAINFLTINTIRGDFPERVYV